MSPYLFLGRDRTLYIGPLASPLSLTLAASRLIVGLEGPIRVRARQQPVAISCHSALLPVGGHFLVDAGTARTADIHLDVAGRDLQRLRQTGQPTGDGWHCELEATEYLAERFRQIHDSPPDNGVMAATLANLLDDAATGKSVPTPADPRVLLAIDHIQQTVTGNPSLTELAEAAGLSRSRLANLFKNQIGVPIRRYRLWHRLFVSCTWLAAGASITDAAHRSGFSDAAHLSHTFRAILDITPSDLFGQPGHLRVAVEPMASLARPMA